MADISVLVCDLGKVLLPFDVERVWRALDPHFEVSPAEARRAVQQLFGETRFGSGGVSGAEFHRRLVDRTGLSLALPEFARAWSDMFWEDADVIRLVHTAPVELRCLLSNTNELHWDFIEQRYPHVLAGFDRLFASHEMGLEKPDPAIYRKVVEEAGIPPECHLFIDDVAANVDGARSVGMDAILHTDSESLWREFRRRGLATEDQRPTTVHAVAVTPDSAALWDPGADARPG